jgi:putative membrane protein
MTGIWTGAGWIAALRATELSVWLLLVAVLLPYAWGLAALWRSAGVGRGISVTRAASYLLGWLVLAFALASPLDTMSDQLFSAHMTQHLLLIAVIPPLLVAGAPSTAMAWAARRLVAGRHRHLTLRVSHGLAAIGVLFTAPWVALGVHTAAMWTWHLPALYELALAHPWWHALEHACFLGTALLLWWSVMRPRGIRRNGYGVGVLVMLATAMQSGALGALFAASRTPWYAASYHDTAAWGLTPLADQQLGGLIMWVPGGTIYVLAACVLFLAWLGEKPFVGSR